jgi:hypothetical protein
MKTYEDRQHELAVEWLKYGGQPGCHRRTCANCGATFYAPRGAIYCSRACRAEAKTRGAARGRFRRCPRFGELFTATRKDTVLCSNACRQAAYRVRATTPEVAG